MTHDEMIAVIAAHRDRSADIEVKPAGSGSDCWMICACPAWNFEKFEYRIKPGPRSWWILQCRDCASPPFVFNTQQDAQDAVNNALYLKGSYETIHVTETPEP